MPEAEPRGPVEHEVKSWPHLFEATLSGVKTHEMRRTGDRDYRTGDTMRLREFDPATGRYSGRELRLRITYVTSSANRCALFDSGLNDGFCILSTTLVGEAGGPASGSDAGRRSGDAVS